jgi:trehalose/maltose hydrolase-like predicted phosphorylase
MHGSARRTRTLRGRRRLLSRREEAHLEFYDPLTTGDSSLSPCIEAIIAAQVGDREKAIEYGMAALLMDLARCRSGGVVARETV